MLACMPTYWCHDALQRTSPSAGWPVTNAAIIRQLGGTRVIPRTVRTDLEFVAALREGLPVAAAEALVASGALTTEGLHRVIIPRRTLALRRQLGRALTAEESDRLARVARVLVLADEVLGEAEKTHRWLRKPNRGLGGQVPLELLSTEAGARVVEQALGRLAHGVVA